MQEAWNILTSPVQYEDELIKIPDNKPWRVAGKDRRFNQGLLVGLGLGLVVTTFLVPFLPGKALTDAQAGAETPKNQAATKPNGENAPQGDTGSQVQQPPTTAPEPAPTPEPPPAPAVVSFVVEEGSSSQEIAAHLKQLGLIQDEQAFLNQVTASGKETALKAGSFELPQGASLDVVIQKLTE